MAKHPFINRTIILLILFFGILQAILYFDNNLYNLPETSRSVIKIVIFTAIAFLVTTIWVRFSVDRIIMLFGDDIEPEQKLFVQKTYSFVMYLIAISVVMLRLGLSLNNLSLMLGFATTGFAFAIREVILSYIVWLMLLTKKPFRIGDFIKIGEEEGKVIHIGTFYVLIDNTPDKRDDFVRIPNKVFLDKAIQNFGKHEILDKVEIPIRQIPKNADALIKKIQKELSSFNVSLISLLAKENGYFLVISFRAPYLERKKTSTKIISKVASNNQELFREFK